MSRAIDNLPLKRALLNDGAEFHYVTDGQGEPIVFIHGGFGDWTSWSPQWLSFIKTHRCFSYSRRFSWPNQNQWRKHAVAQDAHDLLSLLDFWQLPSAILVGTSYGAYTALMLALQAPDRVKAMALTEPPLMGLADQVPNGVQARLDFEAVMKRGAEAYARGDEREAVRIWTGNINGSQAQKDTSNAGIEIRLKNAIAMQALCEASEPFPIPDEVDLQQLSMPILLTSGINSPSIHQYVFHSLSCQLLSAKVIKVENAGHGVHRDQPEIFNRILADFLGR